MAREYVLHTQSTQFRYQYRGADYPGRRDAGAAVLVWLGDDGMLSPALRYAGGPFPGWVPREMREAILRLWVSCQEGAADG